MKILKRAACGVLAAAMLLAAGCSGGADTWAYRAGETQPPVGVYLFYMLSSASNAVNKVVDAHRSEEGYTTPSFKEMLKETVEDQPAEDYVRSEADRMMREYLVVQAKFAEQGLSLDQEQIDYAASTATSSWEANQKFFEDNGISESSMRLVYEGSYKRDMLFEHLYGPGGSEAVPEEEMKAVFEDEYAKVDILLVPGDTPDGSTENKTLAEGYLERANNGEDFYELIYEETLRNLAEGEEKPEKPDDGSQATILADNMKGIYYSDELIDGALAAKMGETVLVEDSNFYYLLRRRDAMEDPADLDAYRDSILFGLKEEPFQEKLAAWGAELNIEVNQSVIDKYPPSKLKDAEQQ